jgi:hypothetical protein
VGNFIAKAFVAKEIEGPVVGVDNAMKQMVMSCCKMTANRVLAVELLKASHLHVGVAGHNGSGKFLNHESYIFGLIQFLDRKLKQL